MLYPSFEEIKLSTITVIVYLSANVDYKSLFYLLPISTSDEPGSIRSVRYVDLKRGDDDSKKNGFKNSLTIRMFGYNKIINLKLSNNKIHICGMKSDEMIITTAELLINKINTIHQQMLPNKIVDNYPVKIDRFDKSMINFNYNLGFSIDRKRLRDLIDQREGFIANFNNTISHTVYIWLPIDNYKPNNRRKRRYFHSFAIHKSGAVTQSGPNIELMKEAYYKFMNIIQEIKPMIQV